MYRILLVAGLTAVVGCTGGDGSVVETEEAWSIESAQIVFTGRRDGVSDLYLLDRSVPDTTRLTFLSDEGASANAPSVSPDGAQVAFQVVQGRNYDIHVMDLAGGASTVLVDHPEYDVGPTWSPDGHEIAFMSTRGFKLGSIGPFPGHIYAVDVRDTTLRQVTREPLTSSLGPSDWTQQGMLMARVREGAPDVYQLSARNGRETQVTAGYEGEYSATYSQAGTRIAFHAETEEASQIVVSDLDGQNRQVLTNGPGFRYYPRWSPDDEWILFTASDRGDQYDIRAVRVSDGLIVALVSTPEDEREADWVP